MSAVTIYGINDFTDFLLTKQSVNQRDRDFFVIRQNIGNNDTTWSCFQQAINAFAFIVNIVHTAFNFSMQVNRFSIQSKHNFVHIRIDAAFTCHTFSLIREVVNTQNHVLRRHDNRFTGSRSQDVVGRHHQNASFKLRFNRKWNVNSHLVTVEVGVERCTNEWVQVNSFTFNQNRLKCLNTQAVQCRRTVQEYWVFTNNFFQDIPNFNSFFFNHTFSSFNCRSQTIHFQLSVNERFEQFQSHFLRQTALVKFKLRTNGNNGTTGIVNTFT